MARYIFTVTTGRTGTAWLSKLIAGNTDFVSVHEPLGIDDFGTQMPDIRTMRTFNEKGMTPVVSGFWQRKFESLSQFPAYAEMNHTLAKCGLLEYLASAEHTHDVSILCIRRNWVDLCASFVSRHDFGNVTTYWQWYLDYRYARNIVNPAPFIDKDAYIGQILWYIAEMEVRQEYYKQLYSGRFKFIDCTLEKMIRPEGAEKLLKSLEVGSKTVTLPSRINEYPPRHNDKLISFVQNWVNSIQFNPGEIAARYISSGRSLM
jgi:hypothetical protein